MPSGRRLGVPILVAVLLLAGCTGVDAPGTSRTSVATTDGVTTVSTTDGASATSTTTETEDGTTTTPSCSVEQSKYGVTPPERPTVLNESTAERVAVGYEERYQRTRHHAVYNLSFYQSMPMWSELEAIDAGFEVTVKLRVDFRTNDGTQASGGYPHTYRVTENGVTRDGTRIACWNGRG